MEGRFVCTDADVCENAAVGTDGDAKIRFAKDSPTKADAMADIKSTNESPRDCQPASVRVRRVRKKTTVRADCSERIPARAKSNEPSARRTMMIMITVLVLMRTGLYCLL